MNTKSKICLFLLVFLCSLYAIIQNLTVKASALSVSAQSAIVLEQSTGKVAFEKNAHTRMGMASTTKIMTALVAIENGNLEKTVEINDKAIGVEGSSIYLQRGEKLTLKELLYALLLQSANDAATAIAFEIGGSVENFAQMMNTKANELGLQNTHFTNPHGLYDENHYTTAYELAIITQKALENDIFRQIVSTKKTIIPLNNGEGSRVLVNHNKMLSYYDGAIGVKTGYTKKTGRCLVSAAERNGTTVIAVTLNAPNDWNDHTKMLDLGFESFITTTLAKKGELCYKIAVVGGKSCYVNVANHDEYVYTCLKRKANIKKEIILDRFLYAPIKKGDKIGQVIFSNNGEEICIIDLIAQESIEKLQTKRKILGIF